MNINWIGTRAWRCWRVNVLLGSWLGRGALCTAVVFGTLLGCGWVGPANSLRFNPWRDYDDLYRLPPLPNKPKTAAERAQETPPQPYNPATDEAEFAWRRAAEAEQNGDWEGLRQALREYLRVGNHQPNRNSATDRLDALQSKGSDKGVRAYLASRATFDVLAGASDFYTVAPRTSTPARELIASTREQLAAVPREPGLRDNIAYLSAALLLWENKPAEAAQAFNDLVTRYPHSEKHEAALFMAAVAEMKSSCSYTGRSGEDNHNFAGKPIASENIPQPCTDTAWHAAQTAFQRYLAAFPNGAYRHEATGWRAYLHLRGSEHAKALIAYYRMLADERDKDEAIRSLNYLRHHATEEELQRVETEIIDEPAVALAYAYHNLYNLALNPVCDNALVSTYTTDWQQEWEAREQAQREQAKTTRRRTVAFATRVLQRQPQARLSSAFALRAAQANLELGENQAARTLSTRALQLGLTGYERQQALWVKGAAEQRLNDYQAARITLNRLIAEDNGGEMADGARRLLAMAAEDAGDFDEALNQYFALGYDSDVAYFIDVLLTPEQVAGYLEHQPQHAQRNQLLYALGIRYLRASRWAEAREALAQVKTAPCKNSASYFYHNPPYFKPNPKDDQTPEQQGICADWVLRDRQTIDELERLESKAAIAQGEEAQAEALYQLASYQFEGGTMLFYNPAAWQHQRVDLLRWLSGASTFRAPNEAQNLFEAAQTHDARARALQIYLDIARRFPATRAARDALFTAAVCHDRLSEMNGYWRALYAQGLHAGERLVKYRDVKKTYPDYRLPVGQAWDWEPSTRTVAGQPAWPPVLKPKPPKSLWMRAQSKASRVWQNTCAALNSFWVNTVWPSLLGLFYALCVVGLAYTVIIAVLLRQSATEETASTSVIRLNLREAESAPVETPVEKIIRDG